MTLGLIAGTVVAQSTYGRIDLLDPKILLSILMWIGVPDSALHSLERGLARPPGRLSRGRSIYFCSGRMGSQLLQRDSQVCPVMNFHLIGVNHKSAPVEVRERLAIPDSRLPEALKCFTHHPGVDEGLILSTCNRVELLAQTKNGRADLRGFLRIYFQIDDADARSPPVRIPRAGCDPPFVPRNLQPGFDGDWRSSDPGAGKGSLCYRAGGRRCSLTTGSCC